MRFERFLLQILAVGTFLLMVPARGYSQSNWQPIATDLIKSEKPGYGGLSGVVVDRQTGDLYVCLSDKGIFRSADMGKTWARRGPVFKGRTETPGCLTIDPVGPGKKIVAAWVYGSPLAYSGDLGQNWKTMNNKSSHIDWFAVDWSDEDMKFILVLKHESGGTLLVSRDGGQSFEELGKDYGPAWIFDEKTALVAEAKTKARPNPRLLRTTDAGKTFQPVGDYTARALPRWHQGTLYWIVEGALISSADKGQTWKKVSDLKEGRFGPLIGKNPQHLFVLTTAGILESTDGGTAWSKPLPLPKEIKGVTYMTWIEYDSLHDVLYATKMASDLFKLERKK